MVKGNLDAETEQNYLGRLKIFARVREFPARVKCASLSWHTLRAAIEGSRRIWSPPKTNTDRIDRILSGFVSIARNSLHPVLLSTFRI